MNHKPKNYILLESRIITEIELKTMLKMIQPFSDQSQRTKKQTHFITDYFLILIGSLTGLRVSEITNIKIGDINENSIKVVGKGSKVRSVPVGRKCRAALDEYLKLKSEILNHPTSQTDFLFINRNRKQFTRFAINRRFDFWRRRSGIQRQINWHSLRHRFATHCLNSGFLVHEVSRFLGHSSLSTTAAYLHLTQNTVDRVNAIL